MMLRNILIVSIGFILLVGCTPKIDQSKYENLHRAAKTMEASITVGVNYHKFGELLQNLSAEFSIANDKAKSDTEKELLKEYFDVLIAYQESATIWKHKIINAQRDWMPSGRIQVMNELQPIVSKYSLPTEPFKNHRGFETISENSIQVIWGKASEHLKKATKLYLGQ